MILIGEIKTTILREDRRGPGPSTPSAPPAILFPASLEEPTMLELATNFAGAMDRWARAGFPTVTAEVYAARAAACAACELWDGSARLGLGKCTAPGCGCTYFKRFLATEICRHPEGSRWSTKHINPTQDPT
jgi:hypothetical protein